MRARDRRPPLKPLPADHYHNDNACDYDHSLKQHSVLIGIALDGHGIYGLYESYNETSEEQVTPDDLDACNGHTHGVPANATYGVDEAAVYARRPASAKPPRLFLRRAAQHYHTTSWAPYTVGCFGPVDSVDECKGLYRGDEVETEGLDVGKCGATPALLRARAPPADARRRRHGHLPNLHARVARGLLLRRGLPVLREEQRPLRPQLEPDGR